MLKGKGILSAIQRKFLRTFSGLADQTNFWLTGGTALAEFYIGHRLSFDLDFFTSEEKIIIPFSRTLEKAYEKAGWSVSVHRRFSTFVDFVLSSNKEEVRLDLALDSPFRFESPMESDTSILVNSYKDLIADKTLAYYGRAEPRDAVDLYFILQRESLDHLLSLAKQKDPGLDPYWFAVALQKAQSFPDELSRWPVKMLVPLDVKELKRLFQAFAVKLLAAAAQK